MALQQKISDANVSLYNIDLILDDKARARYVCAHCGKLLHFEQSFQKFRTVLLKMCNLNNRKQSMSLTKHANPIFHEALMYQTEMEQKAQFVCPKFELESHVMNECECKQLSEANGKFPPIINDTIDDRLIGWYQTLKGMDISTPKGDTYDVQIIDVFNQLRQQQRDYVDSTLEESQQHLQRMCDENAALTCQMNKKIESVAQQHLQQQINSKSVEKTYTKYLKLKQQINCMNCKLIVVLFAICCGICVIAVFVSITIPDEHELYLVNIDHIAIDDILIEDGYTKAIQNQVNDNTNSPKTHASHNSQQSSSNNNKPQNNGKKQANQPQRNNNNINNAGGRNAANNKKNGGGDGGDGGKRRKYINGKHGYKKRKKKKKKGKEKKDEEDEVETVELLISKSAPNPTTIQLNANAAVYVPPNSPPLSTKGFKYCCLTIKETKTKPNINNHLFTQETEKKGEESPTEVIEKRSDRNSKRKKKKFKKRKRHKKIATALHSPQYEPSAELRGRGKILISEEMNKTTIPNSIKEQYKNLNHFIDAATALTRALKQSSFNTDDGEIKIANYDFHDKVSNEMLYCILKKLDTANPANNNFGWKLDGLMTAAQLLSEYGIKAASLPLSFRGNSKFATSTISAETAKIKAVMRDRNKIYKMIKDAKWQSSDVIGIFGKSNGKRSMTLSLQRTEFIAQCRECVKNTVDLIPILVFEGDKYWVEYVWIICVDNQTTNIGISFKCEQNEDVKITAIHCDRDCLLEQHQLISAGAEGQEYAFWDNFTSNITSLDVCGNSPSFYKDKYQTLKQFIKDSVNMDHFNVDSFCVKGREIIKI